MRTRTSKLALAALALLVATQPALARKKPKVDYAPVAPVYVPPPPANGAIFQASNGYAALYEGPRAASAIR